jgi:hypothetical protein
MNYLRVVKIALRTCVDEDVLTIEHRFGNHDRNLDKLKKIDRGLLQVDLIKPTATRLVTDFAGSRFSYSKTGLGQEAGWLQTSSMTYVSRQGPASGGCR